MNKKYITLAGIMGVLIALTMVCLAFMYIQKTSLARDAHNESLYNYLTDNQYVTQTAVGRLSNEIGTMSAICFSYFFILSSFAFWTFRRMIFLFPGVLCCAGMLVWTYLLIDNPLAITFDEVGPVWIIMAVLQVMVAFQLIKQGNRYNPPIISTTSLYHEAPLR